MLAIRFNRTGKKNQASFRVVLQDKRKAPGRRHVEILGSWNPHTKVAVLKSDRILHWVGQGAEVSDSVHNLLVKQGVIEGKSRAIKMPKPVVKEQETTNSEQKAEVKEVAAKAEEVPVVEAVVADAVPVAEVTTKEAVAPEAVAEVVPVAEAPVAASETVAEAPVEKEAASAKA